MRSMKAILDELCDVTLKLSTEFDEVAEHLVRIDSVQLIHNYHYSRGVLQPDTITSAEVKLATVQHER